MVLRRRASRARARRKYHPKAGEILEIYDQPKSKTDAIVMKSDVDYSVCKDDRKRKEKAHRKMVKECHKEFIKNLDYSEI